MTQRNQVVVKNILLTLLVLALSACAVPPSTVTPQAHSKKAKMPAVVVAVVVAVEKYNVCAETLYVRGAPSTMSAPVRWLSRGEVVEVLETNQDGWARIAPAEWINADYLCR